MDVNLPFDERMHHEEVEWWYWTGHLQAEDGRWFGYEHVVFLLKKVGLEAIVTHHAVTDIDDNSFHYTHKGPTFGRPEPVDEGFFFEDGPYVTQGYQGHDVLHGESDGYVTDLTLDQEII